jgi:hypothetical protein
VKRYVVTAKSIVTSSIEPLDDMRYYDKMHLAETSADPRILRKISHSTVPGDINLIVQLLKNPACPSDVLADHVHNRTRSVQFQIAKHRNSSAATLDILADVNDEAIQGCVAGNPATSSETLAKLSQVQAYRVKAVIAMNKHTPKDVLTMLLSDRDVGKLAKITLRKLEEGDT